MKVRSVENLKGAKALEKKKISARNHKSNIWLISAHLSDLETTRNKCCRYISVLMLYSNCSTLDILAPKGGKKF